MQTLLPAHRIYLIVALLPWLALLGWLASVSWFLTDDAVQRMLDAGRPRLDRRELAFLIAPFAILIAGYFLFRYAYYGEWLPNTYYAKHVRPWYESGFRYLCAAAIETGLYLLLRGKLNRLVRRTKGYTNSVAMLVYSLALVSWHRWVKFNFGAS